MGCPLRFNPRPAAALAAFLIPVLPLPAQLVEPGLERAVNWKWRVEPSPPGAPWGLSVSVPVSGAGARPPAPAALRPATYTVRRGDVLIRIAKRFQLTVAQLREFNGLGDDFLREGQVLRIPGPADVLLLKSTPTTEAKKSSPTEPAASDVLQLRLFLAAQGFSTGPASDEADPVFSKILHLFQKTHGDIDQTTLLAQARAAIPDPFDEFELKPSDFRFIAPPKAARAASETPPSITYGELIAADFLPYRSAWEFVAERFQCSETFLRKCNPSLPAHPPAGSCFRVPRVKPFEIENIPATAVQPPFDPAHPVTAAVRGNNVLEISRSGRPVAVFPMGRARPGLKGRGEWKILHAIARPRLATLQEPRVQVVEKTGPFYRNPNPTPTPARAILGSEQFLPAGPNNPAGVAWIHLAKPGSTEPLPYGLHGASMPESLDTAQSVGGFRLSNPDILRAIALLPEGTPLLWTP